MSQNPTLEQLGTGKHIVKFGASWCGPCKALEPVFEEIAAEHAASGINFWSIMIEQDEEGIVDLFAVRSVPLIIFLDEGRVADMLSREQATRDKIIEKIHELNG
jgi:thiol-disulfide isomerase/thioredoxin